MRDTDGLEMRFPFYPYLAFLEMEGYLQNGKLKIEPDMVVIDAGACSGEFSLYATKKVGPGGRVILIEPDPANLKLAEALFAVNGGYPKYLNVSTTGLWKFDGQLRFAAGWGGESQLVDEAQGPPPGSTITSIEVETLATLAKRYGLKRLDLVKMDIEGAEVEVVSAAMPLIQEMRPRFAIASYHPRDGQQTCVLLERMFKELRFTVVTGYPVHLTTWARPPSAS